MRSFCQDRLGANIGKALKTEAFFRRRPTRGVKATLLLLRYEIPIAPWQTIICQDRLGTNIGKSILKNGRDAQTHGVANQALNEQVGNFALHAAPANGARATTMTATTLPGIWSQFGAENAFF
jgi:hypothetical protein